MTDWAHLFMLGAGMLAGGVILHYALAAIDCMNKDTQWGVRIAFILLAGGGFAQILDPWISEDVASGADMMLACGLALLLVFDRRCVACPRAIAIMEHRRKRDAEPVNGEKA